MVTNRRRADDTDFPTLSDKDRAEAIGCLYDVALDPARYEALLDHWESAISPLRARADFAAPRLLDDPQIASHFRRAGEFLDRITLTEDPDEIDAILAPFDRVAALVFDQQHYIRAANEAARTRLNLPEGGGLATCRSTPMISRPFPPPCGCWFMTATRTAPSCGCARGSRGT